MLLKKLICLTMKNNIFIICLIIMSLFSCKKDPPDWHPEVIVPLANSSISIQNIFNDSTIHSNSDSSLYLISDYVLNELKFNDLLAIPDTTLIKTLTLKTIKLGTRVISSKITLGQLAAESGVIGQVILNAHGGYLPVPPIPSLSGGTEEIDATSLFEKIEVLEGRIEANIYNGLPIQLNNVIFQLKNKQSGDILLVDTALIVPPNSNFIETYSLNGKTFEGKLVTEVINISSPGTGTTPVLIDTNDAIDIQIKVIIDKVTSATAIFPAQDLYNVEDDVEYHLKSVKLNHMKIKSGIFRVVVASTLQDSAFINYKIPSAKYMGLTPLEVNVVLPPAKKGDTVYIDKSFPVDDYWFDLTGKLGNKYNTYYHHMIMRIDSTGKMVDLSLNDSLYLFYTLFNVVPEYISGFLGNDSFSFTGTVSDISFLNSVTSGELDLEKLDIGLFIDNEVGVNAKLKIDKIKAYNTKINKEIELSGNNFSDPIEVFSAQNNPLKSVRSEKKLLSSNAKDIVELLPDKIDYDIKVYLNPDGLVSYNDFIYNGSKVKAGFTAEMPLNFSVKGLTLNDTIKLEIDRLPNTDFIESTKFKVIVNNTFPMQAKLQLILLDVDSNILDTIFENPVLIAYPNDNGDKNYKSVESKFFVDADTMLLENLKKAKSMIIQAVLDTGPGNNHKKIYSDYYINVKLIGDFLLSPKI